MRCGVGSMNMGVEGVGVSMQCGVCSMNSGS